MPEVLAQPAPPAAPAERLTLPSGIRVEYASAGPRSGNDGEGAGGSARAAGVFAPAPGSRWALFMVVEGAPADSAALLHAAILRALDRDRGTATARLLRAVRDGCRSLERQALHRFELAGIGFTALLMEEAHASFTQLLPSQAYVVTGDEVRAQPELQMRGAGLVAGPAGRRWEVEIDPSRVPLQPGAAYVLCTSTLSDQLTSARLTRCLRQPPAAAAAALAAAAAAGPAAVPAVLVARLGTERRPQRARLLSVESQRTPRPIPSLVPARPGPPITAWGLSQQRRALPLLGRVLDPPRDVALGPRSRRRAVAPIAAGLATAGALAAGGVAVTRFRGPQRSPADTTGASPAVAHAPPPLAGRALHESPRPLVGLAVVAGVPLLLGETGSVLAQRGDAPPAAHAQPPPDAQWVALAARDDDLLALDAQRRLWRVPPAPGGGEPRQLPLRGAPSWQRPIAAAEYAGNLYVLDAGAGGVAGQIWRHAAGGGGYDGEAQPWMVPNTAAALAGAVAFTIDGSIWVARADGALIKLSGGRPDPFQLSGLDTPVAVAGAVFTERALGSVYLIDSAARRLLRVAKDGRVTAQVPNVFPVGEHPRALWVDEASRRALVLTDRRLQEVPLS